MIALLWFVLAFVWAWGVDKIEDRLPATIGGYMMLIFLIVINPFLWLFLGSLI